MSPAEALSNVLNAKNFFFGGWIRKVGKLSEDSNTIAAINTGGRTPEVLVAIDYPSVQFIARGSPAGNSYDLVYEKMRTMKLLLHAIPQEDADVQSFFPELSSCLVVGDIIQLGDDKNQRPMMSLNFNLITAPLQTGHRF